MILRPFDTKYDNPAIIEEILGYCTDKSGKSTPATVLIEYHTMPDRDLFIGSDNGAILGIAGVRYLPEGKGEIAHLAVVPDARKKGLGREMINLLMSMFGLQNLEAYPDIHTVGFFERCGFSDQGAGKWVKS